MTPGLLDPLRPYLFAIRIALYAILIAFLFTSGCSYGKKKSEAKIADLTAQVQACESANAANMDAISALTSANEAYARQSAEQAQEVAKAQKEVKRAQERAEKEIKAIEKELKDARKDNQDWADTRLPSDYKRLFKQPD